jgi:hypothetical protein
MERIERVAHDVVTTMATRALVIAAFWLFAAVVAVALIVALFA